MTLPIVTVGDPVLRAPAAAVRAEHFGSAALRELADAMIAAMRAAPGVGLAATQVGVPLRLFVVEDTGERLAQLPPEVLAERERTPLPLGVFVNPVVRAVGDEQVAFYEGCLSVPGYLALVPRHRTVEVEAVDLDGRPVRLTARGWPARIFQHEFDHLNGTVYVDRMFTRSFVSTDEPRGDAAIAQLRERLGV